MAKIVDRIGEYIRAESIPVGSLEKSIGAANGTIGRAINKGSDITTEWLSKIIETYPDINPQWLLTGEGDMLKMSDKKRTWLKLEIDKLNQSGVSKAEISRRLGIRPQQLNNVLNGSRGVSDDFIDNFIKEFGLNSTNLYSSILPNPDFESIYNRIEHNIEIQCIPLYNLSTSIRFVDIFNSSVITPKDFIHIPNLPSVDGALSVRGESMTPLFKCGDIIIFKKLVLSLDSILWGQIYILSFDADGDSFTVVKYIQKSDDPERIRLVSWNSHYESKDIPFSSIRALAIVKATITFHTME